MDSMDSVRIALGSVVVTVELGPDGPRTLADVLQAASIALTPPQRVALNGEFVADDALEGTEVSGGDRIAIAGNKAAGA